MLAPRSLGAVITHFTGRRRPGFAALRCAPRTAPCAPRPVPCAPPPARIRVSAHASRRASSRVVGCARNTARTEGTRLTVGRRARISASRRRLRRQSARTAATAATAIRGPSRRRSTLRRRGPLGGPLTVVLAEKVHRSTPVAASGAMSATETPPPANDLDTSRCSCDQRGERIRTLDAARGSARREDARHTELDPGHRPSRADRARRPSPDGR